MHTFIARACAPFTLILSVAGCAPASPPPAAAASSPSRQEAAPALVSTELKAGSGDAIKNGQTAEVNYTGWLFEEHASDHKGKKFDSSYDAGRPFVFKVGAGDVIRGWDEGVAGMRVGGARRLVVPPELGYGNQGAGGVIPPGATLVFDIELLAIRP